MEGCGILADAGMDGCVSEGCSKWRSNLFFFLAATITAAVVTSHFRADTESKKREGLRIGR